MEIQELPVVTENKLLVEIVRQYGQLTTAYVTHKANFCVYTEARIKFLEELINKVTNESTHI